MIFIFTLSIFVQSLVNYIHLIVSQCVCLLYGWVIWDCFVGLIRLKMKGQLYFTYKLFVCLCIRHDNIFWVIWRCSLMAIFYAFIFSIWSIIQEKIVLFKNKLYTKMFKYSDLESFVMYSLNYFNFKIIQNCFTIQCGEWF